MYLEEAGHCSKHCSLHAQIADSQSPACTCFRGKFLLSECAVGLLGAWLPRYSEYWGRLAPRTGRKYPQASQGGIQHQCLHMFPRCSACSSPWSSHSPRHVKKHKPNGHAATYTPRDQMVRLGFIWFVMKDDHIRFLNVGSGAKESGSPDPFSVPPPAPR